MFNFNGIRWMALLIFIIIVIEIISDDRKFFTVFRKSLSGRFSYSKILVRHNIIDIIYKCIIFIILLNASVNNRWWWTAEEIYCLTLNNMNTNNLKKKQKKTY